METTIIEKLDKSMYEAKKWFTFGWLLWYGGFIIRPCITIKIVCGLILLFGMFGWVFFTVNLINVLKWTKIVNADDKLKNALNNELHQLYRYKSVSWSFIIMLATICIFLGISSFYNISALIVCEITLYVGISSLFIAELIYNKE